MPNIRPTTLTRVLSVLAGLLVLRVVASLLFAYGDYFPPNFRSDFLRGRHAYFFGSYQWAFYVHIVSGPIALVLGLILISERFRRCFPQWHRKLGRVQVIGVLLLVSPSGLWMATRAAAGPIAVAGFASLAIVTGACVALGWRSAVKRRFVEHRRWMWRTYLLLCSAVVIRMIGGLATVTGADAAWIDPAAAWVCWLAPLAAYEFMLTNRRRNESMSAQKALLTPDDKAECLLPDDVADADHFTAQALH